MRGLAVLTVALVFASAPLLSTPASAQGTATLDGFVCVLPPYAMAEEKGAPCAYGQPLPGAEVTLTRPGTLPAGPAPLGPTEAKATSDANGRYSFSNLAAGEYTFKVVRAGFEDATGTLQVEGAAVRDFALVGKTVEAKGKVLDGDGKPVDKAEVTLCCDEQGDHRGATGTDGRFTIAVRAGYWSLDVRAPGFQPAYDSALVDGSELDVRLERLPPQDARLSGVVLDQDGNPVADARVTLGGYGGCCYTFAEGDAAGFSRPYYGGENYTFTDGQGRYAMGAYSGENQLAVSKDGYAVRSRMVFVQAGDGNRADVELLKYPEKTARVTGRIVDARTGDPVPYAYLSLSSPEYGLSECSSGPGASPQPMPATAVAPEGPASDRMAESPGCAITLGEDGRFEGRVTPGYAILWVHADWYAMCLAAGKDPASGDCGGQYYSWSATRTLAADGTTDFDVRLRSRPAPDAQVSGYVVDAETGKAVPGAQVSFHNQDNYGYGSAVTDEDGSYRLLLRSGYHTVTVYAEGHLRWEGVLDVPDGKTPFDVTVQPGEEAYGHCCFAYAESAPMPATAGSDGKSAGASSGSAGAGERSAIAIEDAADEGSEQAEQYFDLGGGLGPYDPQARASELEPSSNGSPGAGLVAVLAAVGAVLALRRRRA